MSWDMTRGDTAMDPTLMPMDRAFCFSRHTRANMLTLAECHGAPKMCSACTWQALTPEFTVANGPTGPHNSSSWKCITIHKGRRMDLCGQSAQRSQGNEVKTAQVTAPQPDTHLDTSRSATDACNILQHFGSLVREVIESMQLIRRQR